MTAGEMDLIIGADVNQAIAAFKKLGYEIKKVEQASSKVAQKGKTDFTAFGQVLQDLPFGFIAIQNNITRLLPSAGALGLAISAITAAITFAQTGFSNWTRGFTRSKEEVDEFAKGLNSAKAGAIETGVKLQAFVDIARDNTKSLSERNFALAEANKLMGEHGQKLTLVNINTKAVTDEINNFTQALIQQAVANKFADKVADLVIKQTEAAKEYGKAVEHFNAKTKDAIRTNQQFSNNLNPTGASLGNIFTLIEDGAKVYEGTFVAAEKYKDITRDLKETTDLFNQTLSKSVGLFGQIGTKQKELTKSQPKDKFQWLVPDFNLTVFEKVDKGIKKLIDKPFPIKYVLIPDVADPLADFKKNLDGINATIESSIENLAAAVGEAIGTIFSGQGNPFDIILNVLGQGIKSIGKQLIEIGVIAQIAQKALATILTNPSLALAAGIALVALGTAIANIKQPKKFATGGVVTSPTLALVGEQGPERITPLGYEGRANNNWMSGEVVFNISGQNLRGILRRADQTAYNTF